jgi:hypothetical protein
VSSAPDADPFVQIRLSDLVALRVAAANQTAPAPAPSAPPVARPSTPEYLATKEAAVLLSVTAKGLEAM